MLALGATFINIGSRGAPSHLWIVCSDPAKNEEEIVCANLTSFNGFDYEDDTCLIDRGEHDFVTRRTRVSFKDAKLHSASKLRALENMSYIAWDRPVSGALLKKIQDGIFLSPHSPIRCSEILREQGFAEPA